MEFTARLVAPERFRAGCVAVGIYDGRKLTATAEQLNGESGGALVKALGRGDLGADAGSTLLLQDVANLRTPRLLLIRLGAARDLDAATFRRAARGTAAAIAGTGARDALIALSEVDVQGCDLPSRLRILVEVIADRTYQFSETKSKKPPGRTWKRAALAIADRGDLRRAETAVSQGAAIAAGKALAKDLGNLPGNLCTPTYLAQRAQKLARGESKVTTRILDEARMRRLGMGALLAVAAGTREPAKLIVVEYRGGRSDRRPVVLVGKGVTFDSGGVSLKPSGSMDEMKFDMCGAASVLGTVRAASLLQLPINVVGIIPATENLPGGNATKPGDIVTSASGQTIEILNTDAEGRLILCDALTYARRFEPDVVIDIATLTGACVVALGHHPTGLFSNHPELSRDLETCGTSTGDRVWPMPLWKDYQDQLKSNFADMANVGGRNGGAITAACFLARFTEDCRWAHLDIAGTAWESGDRKGATGRPVPLLTQYLIEKSRSGTRRQSAAKT